MYETVARIKAKYAAMPPPDDYPLYGDFIEFKDEINGMVHVGEVIRHSPFNDSHSNCLWDVWVGGSMITARKSEILRVFRSKANSEAYK